MAEVQKLGREVNLTVVVERYDIVDSGPTNDNSALNQGLNVLKARISLVQSGQHVEYTIRVIYEQQSWTFRKRFNEVAALHEALKRKLPTIPELPSKSVVRQFNPEYLDARKAALNQYLQIICRRRDAMNCPEAQQFFQLPEKVPAFRTPHASEPVQAAEVHEAAFGITTFAYDPMQGLLLLGATDCSWTSRIDTKITNIKLPWEPAAPNLPTSQMSLWRQSPADLRFEMQFTCRYTATISSVILSSARDKGLCLCGLSDGTVGSHAIKGELGVITSGATLPLLRHTAAVVALAIDDVEQWVISASKDNAIMVYDTRRQMIQCEVQTPAPTTSMHYCQVQKRLFTGLQNGKVVVWDTAILPIQQIATIPDSADASMSLTRICALDYDSVTSTLFTGSKEGFQLIAVKTSNLGCWGRKVGQLTGVSAAPTAVAWASSSREILAGFSNGCLVVFDADSGEATYVLQAHKDEITAIVWLDAARRLLTSSKDKTLKIWDFPSLRRTTLEEQMAFVATTPMVSTATGTGTASSASRGTRGTGSFSMPGNADPLLGRPAAGAAAPPLSAANPLARATGSFTSAATGSFTASGSPTAGAAPASRGDWGGLDSIMGPTRRSGSVDFGPTSGSAAAPLPPPPPRSAAQPKAGDSDDDLTGWDK